MKNAGKKLILSLAVILGFIGYVFRIRQGDDEAGAVTANQATNIAQVTNTDTANTSVENANIGMIGKFRNGSYTGSVADAFYGNIQVRATISGGKLTDVTFLQYPNDRNTSVLINTQAMPLLKQEAIQAQSAHVSGVSGASASSQAFVQSLQSALDQAA